MGSWGAGRALTGGGRGSREPIGKGVVRVARSTVAELTTENGAGDRSERETILKPEFWFSVVCYGFFYARTKCALLII